MYSWVKYVFTVLGLAAGLWLNSTSAILAWLCFIGVAVYWLGQYTLLTSAIRRIASGSLKDTSKNEKQLIKTIVDELSDSKNQLHTMVTALELITSEKSTETLNLNSEFRQAVHTLEKKLQDVKMEEARRGWLVGGIAQLNEIRMNEENLVEYAFKVVSHIVKYLNANQGAFYLQEETTQRNLVLRQLATYAYGRRKHLTDEASIYSGEGLLGQCVEGKETILITQVPQNYTKITSGLGEATPSCIALSPLIFRDQCYGALEIASFHKLEEHQVEFLKKISDGIASEIATIKSHEHTKMLLTSSETLTIELRAREEEMQQKMIELATAQEEMGLKMIELQKLEKVESERRKNEAILNGCMDGVISFNDTGAIEFINTAALEIFERNHDELIGREISSLLNVRIDSMMDGDLRVLSNTGNEVKVRTEVTAQNAKGEEIALLLTATTVDVEGHRLFTLFIQKISVELF